MMSKEVFFGWKMVGLFVVAAFIVFKVILPYMDAKKLAATSGRSQGVSEVDTNWDASIATDYSSD